MSTPTDFEIELERIDRDISELEGRALADPLDTERATRFAYRLYQRGSLLGDFAQLEAAGAVLDDLIGRISRVSDLCFLKANLDFKFHRLADVKRDLEMSRDLQGSTQGRALQADLDFQEGRYDESRAGYESLIREERTWDSLARLAHLKFKMGDDEGADGLYAEAVDELTAKEMRHYSWVELQRGVLNLKRGRYADAQAHYERAARAYSGHWMVEEHLAELLAAQGEFDKAIALYEKVIARVPRPEFQQALGELYAFMGKPEQSELWLDRALAAYQESVERGEVHYYHHLADFYADARRDGAEAVKWALRDIELRENFSTLAALAWALYRTGRFDESRETIDRALASGAKDAHLLRQAGTIHRAAGSNGKAEKYLQMAEELNPHHHSFHVHR
ncbi:MAG TPA: tetratricopeptide repeat protein [Pyrinomonadaceae bacterium]|jgi:Tfp pilus assembly protein PilF